MKILSLLFLIVSLNVLAEYPYITATSELNSKPTKEVEVTRMSATKSQDGIGICYGFSSTALLENYRCRSLNISCYDKNQQLSPLDVTSFLAENKRSLKESGVARHVLENIQKSDRKIVKESCLNYSSLLAKSRDIDPTDAIGLLTASQTQKEGWDILSSKWNQFKNNQSDKNKKKKDNCVKCFAEDIKKNIVGLHSSSEQIEEAFKTAQSLEEFLYKSIIPLECLNSENQLQLPNFEVKRYPEVDKGYTAKDLAKKVETVLLNDIPVEISMCTVEIKHDEECPKGEGHSIVLYGIRENCSYKTEKCKRYVRARNSYGWNWQKNNDNGWIELETLMKASHKFNHDVGGNITWIQEPGRVLQEKSLSQNPLF